MKNTKRDGKEIGVKGEENSENVKT